MEKERSHMTERILNLTLEIICLLTGENYTLVKKTSGDQMTPKIHKRVSRGWSRNQRSNVVNSPFFPKPESNSGKKILEVTQKIIELLTGEVPIRCQDVSVYFSMEEWKYLEGHKDLYKDVVMEDHQTLTSPDIREARMNGPTDEKGHEGVKVEEVPIKISKDKRYRRCPKAAVVSPSCGIEDNIIINPPSRADLSSDTSTQEGTLTDHLNPATFSVGESFPRHISNNCCIRKSKLHSQPKSGITSPCSECGKCFTRVSGFTRRPVKKSNPCSECGRCFSQKSNLLRHLRVHTVDKPYMCSACRRGFSQKSDLLRHQRIHTGEKPYSCLVCGRGFARKSNLLRHHRSHSGEKPFSCSKCGKCFAKKQDLVAHQTNHTN